MTESMPCTADILHNKGYRATPQRLAICDALRKAGSHPTVAEIHEYVKRKDPTISLATVYNTLELFTQIGLAREICFRDQPTRYDPSVDSHINLLCINCGRIEDIDFDEFEKILPKIERESGFEVLGQRFEMYGHCSDCNSKKK
jgi:Fur family peroxide stress response transcriptional regulator